MEFKICKIDVDAHMDLAAKYNVASIPTLLVFIDKQALDLRLMWLIF